MFVYNRANMSIKPVGKGIISTFTKILQFKYKGINLYIVQENINLCWFIHYNEEAWNKCLCQHPLSVTILTLNIIKSLKCTGACVINDLFSPCEYSRKPFFRVHWHWKPLDSSIICPADFASRAFSDITLVCFSLNEHRTRGPRYKKESRLPLWNMVV